MCEEYTEESTIFVKVDADQASEVISANGVQAFPTFKVFSDGQGVYSKGGFDRSAVAAALGQHGAVKATAGVKLKEK
jgi:thioredoxin-like negative regulator of GroEL